MDNIFLIFFNVLYEEAVTGGVPIKNGHLKNFIKLTGKHLCRNVLPTNALGLRSL